MLAACLVLLAIIPTTQPGPRVERLENGLTVAVVEDHTLPLVSAQLWYRVGSAADGPERPGLCHVARTVLEHRDNAALCLRAAGVRFESRTLPDACYFASVLPPNFLEYVLGIEAGRMRPLAITPTMVRDALAVAARDYGLESDAPEKVARRRLMAAMFPDHPYQHPPTFVSAALADLSADELDRFLKRWCVASNATLLVVGDVSTVRVLELVRGHFGELPWAETPRTPEAATPESGHLRVSVIDGSPGITLAWSTPPAGLFENAAIDVLMHRLCNPIDGPLAKRLTGLSASVSDWHRDSWRQGGVLVLEVDLTDDATPAPSEPRARASGSGNGGGQRTLADKPPVAQTSGPSALIESSGTRPVVQTGGPSALLESSATRPATGPIASPEVQTANLVRVVLEELQRAATAVPAPVELNRARALATRDVRRQRAAFGNRALCIGWYETVAGELLLADYALPRITGVTVADVQDAARSLAEARSVCLVRGLGERASLPELPPPLTAQPAVQLDSAAALELLAPLTAGAPPVSSPDCPGELTTRRLDSGVRVTLCRLPGLDCAAVRTLLESDHYLPADMDVLMAVGSARRSVAEYRDSLTYRGVELQPVSTLMRAGLMSTGPNGLVPQMVELQAELIRYPRRDSATLETAARTLAEQTAGRLLARADRTPRYPPPGLMGWAPSSCWDSGESPAHVDVERLGDIHAVEVIVVADAQLDDLVEAVGGAWSGWQPAPREDVVVSRLPTDAGVSPPAVTATWVTEPTFTSARLVVSDTWYMPAGEAEELELARGTLAWLLGVPWHLPLAIDGQHAWRWRSYVDQDRVRVMSDGVAGDGAASVTRHVRRAERVQTGRLAQNQIDLALRFARLDRLLSLDSPGAIAGLLQRGVTQPWDLQDQENAAAMAGRISSLYRIWHRTIAGIGPSDESAAFQQLKRESVPPAAADSP